MTNMYLTGEDDAGGQQVRPGIPPPGGSRRGPGRGGTGGHAARGDERQDLGQGGERLHADGPRPDQAARGAEVPAASSP